LPVVPHPVQRFGFSADLGWRPKKSSVGALFTIEMRTAAESSEFEEWYVSHYRQLVAALFLIVGDRSAATEAVDEACARAFERWSRVRRMQSPTGWTLVVARNALRTTARDDNRRAAAHRLSAGAGRVPPPDLSVEVWDAVQRLSRRAREVVALRYLGGLQEHEIAETLGIAPGTVARTLHDARQSLAETLRDAPPLEDRHG
jgi:DNA-directed RNA polymerase specialized sigma24 family protein